MISASRLFLNVPERFGIDPTDLIKGTSPRLSTYTVTRRGEGLPITRRQGFKYLNLAPLFKGKTAEPFFCHHAV